MERQFWLSQLGGEEGFIGNSLIEAKDIHKHPIIHRTDPTIKKHKAQNIKCQS